jgi:hypothetical protein
MSKTRQILLIGIMPGLTRKEVEATRDALQDSLPEFEVRVLTGMLAASVVTIEDDEKVEKTTPNGAYL